MKRKRVKSIAKKDSLRIFGKKIREMTERQKSLISRRKTCQMEARQIFFMTKLTQKRANPIKSLTSKVLSTFTYSQLVHGHLRAGGKGRRCGIKTKAGGGNLSTSGSHCPGPKMWNQDPRLAGGGNLSTSESHCPGPKMWNQDPRAKAQDHSIVGAVGHFSILYYRGSKILTQDHRMLPPLGSKDWRIK